MKTLSVIHFFCFLCGSLFSQEVSYSSLDIPAKLKENAHVVKRYEHISFDVRDFDQTKLRIHEVKTVLDKEGATALRFRFEENKFEKLQDVEIRVFNAIGMQTARYKKKDLYKNAYSDGLVDDAVTYYFSVDAATYPLTVEYKYEVSMSGTLFYPSYFYLEPDESVQQSSFQVKVPVDLDIRYKAQRTDIKPKITAEGKYKVYLWEVKDLAADAPEEGAGVFYDHYPAIVLGPSRFRIYNSEGDMSTWKSFGEWGYDLYNGLDALDESRKSFFRNLVKDARSDREKAAILYNYLQKNFRYVSIQLRIGGWKPFPANFTDEKKYGDCKGLSNFMLAALKAVGVKSYAAIINRGYNLASADPEFPLNRFNHVILCVPNATDTIWLECTSNTLDFAQLDPSTQNRYALLVTENGGVLVRTPASKPTDNVFSNSTDVFLNEDGSGKSHTVTYSTGEKKELMNEVFKAKKDDQKEFLVHYLGFKQPDEFQIRKDTETRQLKLEMDMVIEKIPQFNAGNKMFLNPRLYTLWNAKLPKAEGRKQDFYFRMPFIHHDTTVYHLPAGYTVDVLPSPSDISCAYGTYTTSYVYSEEKRQVTTVARLELKQMKIPAAHYAEVKNFLDKVSADGVQKLIVKKN